MSSYPLKSLKRWGCTAETKVFTFDFGNFLEDYYEVMTDDMDDISSLLSGYVDVLVKSKKGEISLTKNKSLVEKHEEFVAPDINEQIMDKVMVISVGGWLKGGNSFLIFLKKKIIFYLFFIHFFFYFIFLFSFFYF